MKCNHCSTELRKHYSVSQFNQKLICPKCDLKEAMFDSSLDQIGKSVISNAIRVRSLSDRLDFLMRSI